MSLSNSKRTLRDILERSADLHQSPLHGAPRKHFHYSVGAHLMTLRSSAKGTALLASFAFLLWCFSARLGASSLADPDCEPSRTTNVTAYANSSSRIHLLIPANQRSPDLCRLLAGLAALDYPTPSLLAWNERFDQKGLLGGGSHLGKIEKVKSYLAGLGTQHDEELVLMLDAYDIQPQLRPETLVARYHGIVESSNRRMAQSMGHAARKNFLTNKVVFGAGKRCAPNFLHTIACYPLPESPLPADLYGANTDTVIGRNDWSSSRQRFLNSGFIIGPVKSMRPLFQEAWLRAINTPWRDRESRGTGESNGGYHGSDQSIFARMFGQQEFQRENLRLKYDVAWWQRALKLASSRPRSAHFLGINIDNVLSPSSTHEPFSTSDANSTADNEWGITLDYFSIIGHQTVNSATDAQWLIHHDISARPNARTAASQVSEKPRDRFDCPVRIPKSLPFDITSSPQPFSALLPGNNDTAPWSELPLYTHLCLGTIPAFIHYNGHKGERSRLWTRVWYQPHLKHMLGSAVNNNERSSQRLTRGVSQHKHHYRPQNFNEHRAWPKPVSDGGAWTDDKGTYLGFAELCESGMQEQIFGAGEKGAQPLDYLRGTVGVGV